MQRLRGEYDPWVIYLMVNQVETPFFACSSIKRHLEKNIRQSIEPLDAPSWVTVFETSALGCRAQINFDAGVVEKIMNDELRQLADEVSANLFSPKLLLFSVGNAACCSWRCRTSSSGATASSSFGGFNLKRDQT